MRGFPSSFATKQDYLNSLSLYPEQTKSALRLLLSSRFTWEKEKELPSMDEGINDELHRVEEFQEDPQENSLEGNGDGTMEASSEAPQVKIYQMVKKENPHALLFLLGFSVEEVEKLLL